MQTPEANAHYYYDVHFIDEDTGWITSGGGEGNTVIVHTDDGGASWVDQPLPVGDNDLYSIQFHDADHGWVVGTSGYARTDSGGDNWSYVELDPRMTAFHFIDQNTGWMVGERILRSDDGGKTWEDQLNEEAMDFPDDFYSVYFVNEQTGVVAGSEMFYTEDGGDTWEEISLETSRIIESIDFADSQHGWAVSQGGEVFYTETGGKTWAAATRVQRNGRNTSIADVSFVDPQNGWVINSSGGRIYRTEDGGETWREEAKIELSSTLGGEGTVQLRGIHMLDETSGWAVGAPPTGDRETYPNPPIAAYQQ